jgi:hypothetical protein
MNPPRHDAFMSRVPWLPLSGGFLLLGAAVLVFQWPGDPDRPGVPRDSLSSGNSSGDAEGDGGGAPDAVPKKRDRSRDQTSASDPMLRNAMDALRNSGEEDLSGNLEMIVAEWNEARLSSSVAALFAREAADPREELLRISLLRRWASLDPAAAAEWAKSLPPGTARAAALEQIALAWSASDSAAAWQLAESLPNEPAREAAMFSLLYELSRSDPALAYERANSLPESPARARFIEHAVGNWAASDPQAALAKVRDIPDPALRNASIARLATSWAETDPRAAATLAADAMDPGAAQNRAVASIVQRWAQQDAAAARQWVDSFPDGPLKQNAMEHIAVQSAPMKPVEEEMAD